MKEKVNWRLQYKLDNIFNLVMFIFVILTINVEVFTLTIDDVVGNICLGHLLLVVQFFVNLSASRFFYDNKYE